MAKAVIMAGGQGERFWPLTHARFPKYRIRFQGKRSLLQNTFDRVAKVYGRNNVYIVSTAAHAGMIREELPKLPRKNLLIEPFRKNTCAAIYLSCEKLRRSFGEKETVSFFAADHLIQKEHLFASTMRGAVKLAGKSPVLVTIGIKPSYPATGFGYIEKGRRTSTVPTAFKVKRFIEKPPRQKAVQYLRRKRFYWNSGIFTWRLDTFFDSMRRSCPHFVRAFDLRHLQSSYAKLPSISIDYALMEKASNVAVCPTSMDWCDMGGWDALFDESPQDRKKVYAEGFYYHQDVDNSLVVNQSGMPLVVLGLSGIVVVQTPRGTLVCPKGRSSEAALLVKKLK